MDTSRPDVDKLADEKDIDGLIMLLSHRDNTTRYRACGALGRLGAGAREAVPALIELLQHWDGMTRGAAAGALGAIGPDARDAIPALERALLDPDNVVKMCAASALRDISPGAGKGLQSLSAVLGRRERPPHKSAWQAIGESMSTPIDPMFYANPFF